MVLFHSFHSLMTTKALGSLGETSLWTWLITKVNKQGSDNLEVVAMNQSGATGQPLVNS